ncbi:hypothetical protein EUGRSUZ_L02679 [Eucalyptus grandis]|uniref:AAA+ ATPase domain-containing protein n=1 Tax=Eucalyptus grandis TaxID=71139 RepID=A0AAD9T8R0_EUCGR|nr:hypothetical protein EUGRSUZ_L02679 [Eucalyptus grandis]
MELAGPLLETVKGLWGLASKPVGYIYNLKVNVRLLDEKNKALKSISGDVKTKVEREEVEAHVGPTKQVEDWFGRVQKFSGEVDQILREARERDEIKCLSRWLPRNCRSSYKLGKRVDQLLNEVRQLQNEKFRDVTSPLPPPSVLKKPMDNAVGLEISLNKVLKCLMDEKQVGVIGLYGTGGVGKTTLMKRINEELSHANHKFNVVIWVVVSRQVNEDSIQDTIRKRLNIKDQSWGGWSQDEMINYLWERLTDKKFVLLIDDVWARLDLSKIGVPRPSLENGSKVVFTTRSMQVCDQMQADKTFKVQCLKFKEALELFENNVGKSTIDSHPDILELAKDIVRECKGLPLALITVGRAMAGRKKPSEWRNALGTLKNNPYKLSGMEEVYHILEFSYISLDESTGLCFLYCCLFPEDYHIKTHDLIELWIGERLLGDTNDVHIMRDKGEYILGSLKMACLLESGHYRGEEYVKMHDVIRDMTIWITHDHGQRENKLLVIEREEDLSTEMISKWGEAEKVSLWEKRIRTINQAPPECSRLKTLIVRETEVTEVPTGFFESMTACLVVLDLSNNDNIKSFPEGICNLISLRYLNLSNTRISEMPKEIKNLTRLRWLLLNHPYYTRNVLIFRGSIASFSLNVFSSWDWVLEKEEEVVEELGRMQGLNDLSINVQKSSSALKIFQSYQRCIRRASIMYCEDLTYIPISHSLEGSGNFSHLEVLFLHDCHMLVKMEITYGKGQAINCYCFPNLVEVSELAASRLFSRLKYLKLRTLPNLRSICDHALFFPQGVRVGPSHPGHSRQS